MQATPGSRAEEIHLSVVATSRNDNHGGSLTQRMQHFVDGFVAQCNRHNLRAELVLVEWNPPSDRKPLVDALQWPAKLGPCDIRIITVPREIHASFDHAEKLPLFQMIAKNAGIRRARGRFVLATNIDILFSDQIIRYMRDRLRPGRLYRADRCDVPPEVPRRSDFGDVLEFCNQEMFRIHANGYTASRDGTRWPRRELLRAWVDPRVRYILFPPGSRIRRLASRSLRIPGFVLEQAAVLYRRLSTLLSSLVPGRPRTSATVSVLQRVRQRLRAWHNGIRRVPSAVAARLRLLRERLLEPWPFTNACGDFTLLSRDDWFRLRGYPEWHIFSWHLDSVLIYQAGTVGIGETHAGYSARVFHIEHGAGSGFTPEAARLLFSRLKSKAIPFLTDDDLLKIKRDLGAVGSKGQDTTFNAASWGLAQLSLPDVSLRETRNASPTAVAFSTQAAAG